MKKFSAVRKICEMFVREEKVVFFSSTLLYLGGKKGVVLNTCLYAHKFFKQIKFHVTLLTATRGDFFYKNTFFHCAF